MEPKKKEPLMADGGIGKYFTKSVMAGAGAGACQAQRTVTGHSRQGEQRR